MGRKLTDLQAMCLDFMWEYICDEEMSPSNQEIADHCQINASNVPALLRFLELRECITRKKTGVGLSVWSVRLPDGRNASMDLWEQQAQLVKIERGCDVQVAKAVLRKANFVQSSGNYDRAIRTMYL